MLSHRSRWSRCNRILCTRLGAGRARRRVRGHGWNRASLRGWPRKKLSSTGGRGRHRAEDGTASGQLLPVLVITTADVPATGRWFGASATKSWFQRARHDRPVSLITWGHADPPSTPQPPFSDDPKRSSRYQASSRRLAITALSSASAVCLLRLASFTSAALANWAISASKAGLGSA